MPDSIPCPYCGAVITPAPSRKKKCPHCGETVLIRRGTPLTEVQAAEFDELRHIDSWVSLYSRLGVTHAKFDKARERLSDEWHVRAPVNDTKWAVLLELKSTTHKSFDLVEIYREMIAIVESEGKDASALREKHDNSLERAIKQSFLREAGPLFNNPSVYITTTTAGDQLVCDHCQAASKRQYTPKGFLDSLPIPHGCESSRGCRCWYTIRFRE